MLSRPLHVVVGGLALLLVLGIAGLGIWADFHPRSRATVPYVLVSDGSVQGIRPGAPVLLRGVLVGGVRAVGFAPDNPRLIRVRIAVLPGTPIFQGAYAEISLLGATSSLRAIELHSDRNIGQRLATAAEHPAHIPIRPPATDASQLQQRQALQTATLIAQRAKRLMGKDNRAQLARMQENLRNMNAQVTGMRRQWQSNAKQMTALSTQARQTLTAVKLLNASTQAAARLARQRVQALGQQVAATTQQLKVDRQMLQLQWRDNLAPNYGRALSSTRQALQGAQQLAAELRAQPQSVLLGKPDAGPDPGDPGFRPEAASETLTPAAPP